MKLGSLDILLASSHVLRCHTMPCLNRPTVGHHTFRTLIILHWLYFPNYPSATVNYCMLIHDVPEVSTGDMPGHIKADNPEVANTFNNLEIEFEKQHGLGISIIDNPLSIAEKALLGFCDRVDLTWYSLDEMTMGNRNMQAMARKAHKMAYEKYNILITDPVKDLNLERVSKLMHKLDVRMEGTCR